MFRLMSLAIIHVYLRTLWRVNVPPKFTPLRAKRITSRPIVDPWCSSVLVARRLCCILNACIYAKTIRTTKYIELSPSSCLKCALNQRFSSGIKRNNLFGGKVNGGVTKMEVLTLQKSQKGLEKKNSHLLHRVFNNKIINIGECFWLGWKALVF